MDWRSLPSLSALRAFEATARRRSFSAAARDLNVTHAAIAQHVRGLEAHFGEPLAYREGQMMQLTAAGQQLANALEEGFSIISDGVRELTDQHSSRPLQVSLTPSFAESWLMPRLGDFWTKHPEIELALNPSMSVVDLRRDGFDIALRFGKGNWPGLDIEPLTLPPFTIVGAPSLIKGRSLQQMGDLGQYKWYNSSASAEEQIWGQTVGLDFTSLHSREMLTNGLALSAVRAGYGLAIQAELLVEADLKSGALVSLMKGDPGGLGYYMVTRKGFHLPALDLFQKWLRKVAQED